MKQPEPPRRDLQQTRDLVEALEAMARGEVIDAEVPPKRIARESPLSRTQRIRISGRTIRSGLE